MANSKKTKKKVILEQPGTTPKDLFIACLVHWPWFIVSLILCSGLGVLYLLSTPPSYERKMDFIIKTDAASISSEVQALDQFTGMYQANSGIVDEIATIQSPKTIEETVSRLHLNVQFTRKEYLRTHLLYANDLPISISFVDFDDSEVCNFEIALNGERYTISQLSAKGADPTKVYVGNFNDTIQTAVGRLVVKPSGYYNKSFNDFSCHVAHLNLKSVAKSFGARFQVAASLSMSSIVHMVLSDERIPRGDDFLNTVVSVYSDNWVAEHNKNIKSTSDFIEQRIGVIAGELGDVEQNITSFMSSNRVPSLDAAAGTYFQQANMATETLDQLSNQITRSETSAPRLLAMVPTICYPSRHSSLPK